MNVLSWLEHAEMPANYYEFLGRPCFDPDSDALRAAVRDANRALLPYQNHNSRPTRDRALRLIHELGRAGDAFSSEDRRAEYDRQLARTLLEEYRRGVGPLDQSSDLYHLRAWLLGEKRVPAAALDLILAELPDSLRHSPAGVGSGGGDEPIERPAGPGRDGPEDEADILLEASPDLGTAESDPTATPIPYLTPPPIPYPTPPPRPPDSAPLYPLETIPTPGWRRLLRPEVALAVLVTAVLAALVTQALPRLLDRTPEAPNLTLDVRGDGATLLVDGRPTPLDADHRAALTLAPGPHPVRATWPDGESLDEVIHVGPGHPPEHVLARPPRDFELKEPDGHPVSVRCRPDTFEAYQRADDLLRKGDRAGAGEILRTILRDEPEFWPALVSQGEIALSSGSTISAGADFDAVRDRVRQSSSARTFSGDVFLRDLNLAVARGRYDEALEVWSQSHLAHAGLALIQFYEGRFDEAERQATAALDLDPTCVRALIVRAAARDELLRDEQARADCDQALQLEPGSLLAFAIRSKVHAELENSAQAVADAKRAAELENSAQAVADAKRAAELAPTTLLERIYMAPVYLRLGQTSRYEDALQAIDEARDTLGTAPR